jgi:hypothetical protein
MNLLDIPCTLLGRLTVDQYLSRKRLRARVAIFYAKKAAAISIDVASYAVIVDAKDIHAKEFYMRHGFIELKNQPIRFFIGILVRRSRQSGVA